MLRRLASDLGAKAHIAAAQDAAIGVEHDFGSNVELLGLVNLIVVHRCGPTVPIEVMALQRALARLATDSLFQAGLSRRFPDTVDAILDATAIRYGTSADMYCGYRSRVGAIRVRPLFAPVLFDPFDFQVVDADHRPALNRQRESASWNAASVQFSLQFGSVEFSSPCPSCCPRGPGFRAAFRDGSVRGTSPGWEREALVRSRYCRRSDEYFSGRC